MLTPGTRLGSVGLLAALAVVFAGGCKDFKGPGFSGGFELGGLSRTPTGSTVTICIDSNPCMRFARDEWSSGEMDFYAIYNERGGSTLPNKDGAKVMVEVTVSSPDHSVLLHGSTGATIDLFQPNGCFGYAPVIAVAFDASGELRATKATGQGPNCSPGPTTRSTS